MRRVDYQYAGTLATVPIGTRPPYTRAGELCTLAFPFEAGQLGRDLMRQEGAHPHQIVVNTLNAAERELLVSDLGNDRIWQLAKAPDGRWVIRDAINTKTGGGPRHVATYGAYAP